MTAPITTNAAVEPKFRLAYKLMNRSVTINVPEEGKQLNCYYL
jgi:hypothetical protein